MATKEKPSLLAAKLNMFWTAVALDDGTGIACSKSRGIHIRKRNPQCYIFKKETFVFQIGVHIITFPWIGKIDYTGPRLYFLKESMNMSE